MCNDTPFFVLINKLYPVYDDGCLSLVQQNMEWRNAEPMATRLLVLRLCEKGINLVGTFPQYQEKLWANTAIDFSSGACL